MILLHLLHVCNIVGVFIEDAFYVYPGSVGCFGYLCSCYVLR